MLDVGPLHRVVRPAQRVVEQRQRLLGRPAGDGASRAASVSRRDGVAPGAESRAARSNAAAAAAGAPRRRASRPAASSVAATRLVLADRRVREVPGLRLAGGHARERAHAPRGAPAPGAP